MNTADKVKNTIRHLIHAGLSLEEYFESAAVIFHQGLSDSTASQFAKTFEWFCT